MKHLFTLLALTIGFSMYGQLGPLTENGIIGQRLLISNASNHGNIGFNAIDLSYSISSSTTFGATGSYSFATGYQTIAFGDYSTAIGEETEASGNRTLASGYQTIASGNRSTAIGNTTTSSGYSSTAMGNGSIASGTNSTAMGNGTTASGTNSIAMGNSTTASGATSAAMGINTTAFGEYSTAMGNGTTASDFVSLVIGQHNLSGSTITNSATEFNTANTAFVIGNGTGSSSKSDAFKVLFNGNTTATGSVTATSFIGDGSQLSGIGILSPVTENTNTGVRLSTSNASNYGNIGSNAVDLSYSNSASTTLGATGANSIAMGNGTTASGATSAAMGQGTTASGDISTAMGFNTTAVGYNSTAMGINTTASGANSTAMGEGTTASAVHSTAMGRFTTASDYGSLVIGHYNLSGATVTNSATEFNLANTAFVIGNGAGSSNKSDAFSVLFSGETVIGNDLEVKGNVLVSSDARLKANIISLGSTLAKLLLIDGKRYTMKKDGKQNIGVLAQDIQKVFPELVSTDNRDMLAVNYQGLVPVLINALKEQDAKMKEQEKRLERLEAIISKIDR